MITLGQMHIVVVLEAHRMRIHMNVVTMSGLVLVEGMMTEISDTITMKEEVLDMIKKFEGMVITEEVLVALTL